MQEAKKRTLVLYLKTLQITRRSLMAAILVFVILQMAVLGLMGALICGVLLLPQDFETKLWILFGLFSLLFTLPLVAFSFILSESTWFKYSGAKDLIR